MEDFTNLSNMTQTEQPSTVLVSLPSKTSPVSIKLFNVQKGVWLKCRAPELSYRHQNFNMWLVSFPFIASFYYSSASITPTYSALLARVFMPGYSTFREMATTEDSSSTAELDRKQMNETEQSTSTYITLALHPFLLFLLFSLRLNVTYRWPFVFKCFWNVLTAHRAHLQPLPPTPREADTFTYLYQKHSQRII